MISEYFRNTAAGYYAFAANIGAEKKEKRNKHHVIFYGRYNTCFRLSLRHSSNDIEDKCSSFSPLRVIETKQKINISDFPTTFNCYGKDAIIRSKTYGGWIQHSFKEGDFIKLKTRPQKFVERVVTDTYDIKFIGRPKHRTVAVVTVRYGNLYYSPYACTNFRRYKDTLYLIRSRASAFRNMPCPGDCNWRSEIYLPALAQEYMFDVNRASGLLNLCYSPLKRNMRSNELYKSVRLSPQGIESRKWSYIDEIYAESLVGNIYLVTRDSILNRQFIFRFTLPCDFWNMIRERELKHFSIFPKEVLKLPFDGEPFNFIFDLQDNVIARSKDDDQPTMIFRNHLEFK
jgi:hypothetical protein